MSELYRFPAGKWEVQRYDAPTRDSFTGMYTLKQVPFDPNQRGTHWSAMSVYCDDPQFIAKLLEHLNEITK